MASQPPQQKKRAIGKGMATSGLRNFHREYARRVSIIVIQPHHLGIVLRIETQNPLMNMNSGLTIRMMTIESGQALDRVFIPWNFFLQILIL